jgi:gluconokinase
LTVVVLMGVSGVGKTTVGERLAAELGWTFHDADAFHPPANVAKMRSGAPLDDTDREPWLAAMSDAIGGWLAKGEGAVLACSALKQCYREALARDRDGVVFVHLEGSRSLIASRLAARRGHYMPASLLDSQIAALEPPDDAITVDVTPTPEAIVAEIRRRIQVL